MSTPTLHSVILQVDNFLLVICVFQYLIYHGISLASRLRAIICMKGMAPHKEAIIVKLQPVQFYSLQFVVCNKKP